jgi:hypothetical protein
MGRRGRGGLGCDLCGVVSIYQMGGEGGGGDVILRVVDEDVEFAAC